MEQTKIESLIETSTDMVAAFIISWMVMLWFIPMVYPNHASTVHSAFGVVFIFTVTSFIRRYLTRRFFARGFHLVIHKIISRFFI